MNSPIQYLQLYINKNPLATKQEAVFDMLSKMWKPVVMTSVTTAVGFISLITSQVYPIKYFGLFTAFGVMAAMLFSLLLIPAGILILGLPKARVQKDEANNNHHFANNMATKSFEV